jgi:hypothetical protein
MHRVVVLMPEDVMRYPLNWALLQDVMRYPFNWALALVAVIKSK